MPIFFKSPTKPVDQSFEPIVLQALATDKIVDPEERRVRAKELLSGVSAASGSAPVIWWRIAIAFVLMVGLFILAIKIDNSKASETLLTCFQLLFTATLGLFGIEASRNG